MLLGHGLSVIFLWCFNYLEYVALGNREFVSWFCDDLPYVFSYDSYLGVFPPAFFQAFIPLPVDLLIGCFTGNCSFSEPFQWLGVCVVFFLVLVMPFHRGGVLCCL